MSARIIFDSKSEIPENFQGEVKETEGGKFEISADGLLKKNKELLGKNATLSTKVEELEAAREAAEAQAKEWKGKAKIPHGQRLVADEIAELGEAAKAAELVKDELPSLKTAKTEIESKLNALLNEKTIAEVAASYGFNNRFKLAAQDKNLQFEKAKDGDKDVWQVVTGETKTNFDDFLKTDGYFKEFKDTFTDAQGKRYAGQESGKKSGTNLYDQIREEEKQKRENAPPPMGFAKAFGAKE